MSRLLRGCGGNRGTRSGLFGTTRNELLDANWKTWNSENWQGDSGDTWASSGVVNIAVGPVVGDQWIAAQTAISVSNNGDIRFKFSPPTLGLGAVIDIQAWFISQDGLNGYGFLLKSDATQTTYDAYLRRIDAGVMSDIYSVVAFSSMSTTGGLWLKRRNDGATPYLNVYRYNTFGTPAWEIMLEDMDAAPAIAVTLAPAIIVARAATSAPTVTISVPILAAVETSDDASLA